MTTKIIAHRGASKLAPENTMPAFELAYQMKAEGIETDIQLTKDNIPVIIHDEQVKRTTNGTGYIKELTYNQLKQLDAGSWFSSEFSGTSIISLDEFLQWVKDKSLWLNIELKNNKIDYKHLEPIAYEMIDYYQLLNRTTFSTFNPNSVKRMKSFNNEVGVSFLTSKRNKNLVKYAKELGATGIHIKYRLLDQSISEQCQQENMELRVFTVNKATRMMKCFKHQCDGVFTDVPDEGLICRNQYYTEAINNNKGALK